jgi:proteasome accessory factor B
VAGKRQVRVPVEERLFSLVLALLATDGGLTKNEILSTVQGYRQQYAHGGDNANLERQFERDKDNIRELGVPLDTIEPLDDPGGNHALRYVIPRGDYDLPADITFTPEEITLLNLAGMVWREGSLSRESQRALMKLRSLGVTPTEPVLGYAPRLRVREPAFEPLAAAIEKHQSVVFSYLKPGDAEASVRELEPLALFQHQGRWHLSAREPDTGAVKTFLLRRIVSQVVPTGATFVPPAGDLAAEAIASLERRFESRIAVVRAEPGTDAATRLANRRGVTVADDGAFELRHTDSAILADELAGFGPEVLVMSPPELRESVLERLERSAADHG